MSDCIFCKIAAGDSLQQGLRRRRSLAFHDIRPLAPVHFLIIPKLHVASLAECGPEHEALLGRIMGLVPRLAAEQGLAAASRPVSIPVTVAAGSVPPACACIRPQGLMVCRAPCRARLIILKGSSNGFFQYLALADCAVDRGAGVWHQKTEKRG
jgi:histidine triad (HIT) family protein